MNYVNINQQDPSELELEGLSIVDQEWLLNHIVVETGDLNNQMIDILDALATVDQMLLEDLDCCNQEPGCPKCDY